MNCCSNCFLDPILIKIISTTSTVTGDCDFCSTNKTELVSCEELSIHFESLFDLYTLKPSVFKAPKIDGNVSIYDHINEYWPNLFNHRLLDDKIIKFLIDHIAKGSANYEEDIFRNPVEFAGIAGDDQDSTDSLELQWDSFANDIKYNNRFFLNEKLDTDFLQSIFERLGKTFPPDTEFYRARISNHLLPAESIGKPEVSLATGGRANPVGIPYLYLCNDLKTTLYETRISLHETLSIGKFRSKEHINLISLTNVVQLGPLEIQNKGFALEEFIGIRAYLQKLESELSKPVRKQDVHLDYLPTQFLCEFFKSIGFDAVEYKSSMNPEGSNIALFNDSKVECLEVKFYQVNSLEYNWDEL